MDKIRVLFVTDDIRMHTGVGIQAKKLCLGLVRSGKFEVSVIGGSDGSRNFSPVLIDNITLYPISPGYGNIEHFRVVYRKVRPHIVVLFSDPRFFEHLFTQDNEIRHSSKIVLYHTWDNAPFPKFNLPWYAACDDLVMISDFSHTLFKESGVETYHIPHGVDPTEFYPLPQDFVDKEREHMRKLLNRENIKFFIFWNNRNIWRKRPMDVINIFQKFYDRHSDVALLLNTAPLDPQGTNLPYFIENCTKNLPIIANYDKASVAQLNLFYNVADVTINIAYNEGFGLCVTESLATGTPVIATATGGMPEQMVLSDGTILGHSIKPTIRSYFGVIQAPYIFTDYVSDEDVLEALEDAYTKTKQNQWKKVLGPLAVGQTLDKYHTEKVVDKWRTLLEEIHKRPSMYKRWHCITV